MKAFIFILAIVTASAGTVHAQTKTQESQAQAESGRAKYAEVTPFSLVPEKNRKKISLRPGARRTEPVVLPVATQPAVAQQNKRIEGRLAENQQPAASVPAFK